MELLRHKSPETYQHCVRVALLAELMGTALKYDNRQLSELMQGCFLHDLGKILVPQEIISKTAPLSAEEWTIMRLHPQLGAELLENHGGVDDAIIRLVHSHHERWDGRGYPQGLAGLQIPLNARICAVIDAFDCMISVRPYRRRMSVEEAKDELIKHSGKQFDSEMVQLFLKVFIKFPEMYLQ
ncbi:HD-GYP domain-containing protein [Paenibacillaceae bacterium]|nr:HD-GYP domain-containing protein [Paenibacillaceae bacterium]